MVTYKDLNDLREENKKDRHELKNHISNQLAKIDSRVDDRNTDIELLKQWHNIMTKALEEIKKDTKEGFKEIKDLINGLDKKFATKADHTENKRRIDSISKILWFIWAAMWTAIIWAIMATILNK